MSVVTGTLPVSNAPAAPLSGVEDRDNAHPIARSPVNGVVWAMVGVAPTVASSGQALIGNLYRSEDNGATWVYVQQFIHPASTPVSTPADVIMHIDIDGYLHVLYRGGANAKYWNYKRGTIQGSAGSYSWSFSTNYTVSSRVSDNGAYETYHNATMAVHRNPSGGWTVHVGMYCWWTDASGYIPYDHSYPGYNRINITSAGSISLVYGSTPYNLGQDYVFDMMEGFDWGQVALDFKHTGDGITNQGTPEVYISWQEPTTPSARTQTRLVFRKLTHSSGTSWTMGSKVVIESGPNDSQLYFDVAGSFWDGSKYNVVVDGATTGSNQAKKYEISSTGALMSSYYLVPSSAYNNIINVERIAHDRFGNIFSINTWSPSSRPIGKYANGQAWATTTIYSLSGRGIDDMFFNMKPVGDWMHILYSDYDSAAGTSSGQTVRCYSFQMTQNAPTTAPRLIFPITGERFENRVSQDFIWENSSEAIAQQYLVEYKLSWGSTSVTNEVLSFTDRYNYPANTLTDEATHSVNIRYFDGDVYGPPYSTSVFLTSWYQSAVIHDSSSTPVIPNDRLNVIKDEVFDGASSTKVYWTSIVNGIYYGSTLYGAPAPVYIQSLPENIRDALSSKFAMDIVTKTPVTGKPRQAAATSANLKTGKQYRMDMRLFIPTASPGTCRLVIVDATGNTVAESAEVTTKNSWQDASLTFTVPESNQYYVGYTAINPVAANEHYYGDRMVLRDTNAFIPEEGSYEYKVGVFDQIGASGFSTEVGTFTIGTSTNVYHFDGSLWVPATRKVFDGTLWKDHLVQKL